MECGSGPEENNLERCARRDRNGATYTRRKLFPDALRSLHAFQKAYMRALAELGKGQYRSADVAQLLGTGTDGTAAARAALIRKGMVYAPAHGDVCFTVPLFDEFMRRVIQDFVPRAPLSPSARDTASFTSINEQPLD